MKKSYQLLSLIVIAFSSIVFSSFRSGLAHIGGINGTGDNVANGSCAGASCHAPNSSLLLPLIRIERPNDSTHTQVNSYVPNQVYKIYLSGASTGGRDEFAYQLSVLDDMGYSTGFIVLPNHLRSVYVNGVDVYETKQPIEVGNYDYIDSFTWVAPAASAGTVTFNLTMLASNDDGSSNGDVANSVKRVIHPQTASVFELNNTKLISIYPNPASDQFYINTDKLTTGHYQWAICDPFGRIIDIQDWHIHQSNEEKSISIGHLPMGNYYFILRGQEQIISMPFVKL